MAKDTGKKLADMLYGGNPEQAAFGVFPQMKGKRSKQDPQAAKNVPVDLLRGAVSGVLGAPGDIESLIRLLPGLDERTILPTSEEIEGRLPFKSDTPVSRAATGVGQLGGGFYTGPGSPFRLVGAIPGALKHGAEEFAKASAGSASHVVKPKGGNWLTGNVEGALENLKRGETTPQRIAELEAHLEKIRPKYDLSSPRHVRELADMEGHIKNLKSNLALNNWVESNLTNYVKKEMATPEDPVRKLAEQGIVHREGQQIPAWQYEVARKKSGFPVEGMGQSTAAKDWENLADSSFVIKKAKELADPAFMEDVVPEYRQEFSAKNLSENPWLAKVDPETNIYHVSAYDLGFDHIMDVLREAVTTGKIRPEQLNKVSMEQAVRMTHQYDQELAEKMAQARVARREGLPVYKEYPEGYRWIELNKPGAFASESEAMGHSVRGYEPPQGHPDWSEASGDRGSLGYGHGGWEGIKSGKAKVYSLVDPKGNPHVTVEVGANNHLDFNKWWDSQPKELRDEINARARRGEHNMSVFEAPEYLAARDALPPRITQIKGKQNRAPADEYLPFVQDFVRSGQWSDVGDLHNTGMRATRDIFSEAELQKLRDLGHTDLPHIMPGEEIQRYHNMIVPEGQRLKYDAKGNIIGLEGAEGMAHGGRVHFSDNPDTMALELAGGGLVKGLVKAVKGTQEVLPAAEREANLAKMLSESSVKDRMYHGTTKNINQFIPQTGDAVFLTPDPKFAGKFAWNDMLFTASPQDSGFINPGANVMPVYVQAKNPFDYENPKHIRSVLTNLDPRDKKAFKKAASEGSWQEIEKHIGTIQDTGFDSVFLKEMGRKNLAVFEPNQIKSAIGNRGTYDVTDPDITKAEGGEVHMAGGGGALAKLAKAAKAAKEAAVPLDIPRVRPTTQAIIEAAERVGRQQLGEHVTNPLTGKPINLAGRSKKEAQRLKEIQYEVEPIKDLPKMQPYEAKLGEVNIALPGDQTISDMLLKSVEGTPIGSIQEGGAKFGRGRLQDPEEIRAFWASNPGPAQNFQNKVDEIARMFDTDQVTAYHLAMGQTANNFAQHLADANMRAIDYSKLNKNKMDIFDSHIAAGFSKKDKKTGEYVHTTFPEWPGIANPEAALQAMKENPELRKWFNSRMKTEDLTKATDLPYGKGIEWAISEPELRNMEINLTGLSAGRMKPGAKLIPESAHQTYSHDIPGTALGHAPELAPFSISFPDVTDFVSKNYRPQDFTGTIQKVFPHQVVDEAYLEDMDKYYRQLRKVRGFAEGGDISADDLILEERKL